MHLSFEYLSVVKLALMDKPIKIFFILAEQIQSTAFKCEINKLHKEEKKPKHCISL